MSKAFTRESEHEAEEEPEAGPALPPGLKNYITRRGFEALRVAVAADGQGGIAKLKQLEVQGPHGRTKAREGVLIHRGRCAPHILTTV